MTQFLIRLAYGAGILGLIYIGFAYALPLLMPFLLAFLFSLLLRRPVLAVSGRLKVNRRLLAALMVTLFYILLAFLTMLVGSRLFSFARTSVTRFNDVILPAVESLRNAASRWTGLLSPESAAALEGFSDSLLVSLRSKLAEVSARVIGSLMSALPSGLINMLLMVIATYFISLDFGWLKWAVARHIKAETYEKAEKAMAYFAATMGRLLRSYSLILLITFTELSVGLSLLGIENSVLIALGTALLDILPVLGSGTVLLPWTAVCLLTGQPRRGLGLLVLYVVLTVIRQMMEPKIVGDHVGLHPLLTLMCMFVGFRLFGGTGMLGLPILCAVLLGLNRDGVIHLLPVRQVPLPKEEQKKGKPFPGRKKKA